MWIQIVFFRGLRMVSGGDTFSNCSRRDIGRLDVEKFKFANKVCEERDKI